MMHAKTPHRTLIAAVSLLLASFAASGQLVPERLYYGVDRAIPMTVVVPEGMQGEARIELFGAPKFPVRDPIATAEVAPGRVDLAQFFPVLWETQQKSNPKLLYAQLVIGDTEIAPPIVIQPLATPSYARGAGSDRPPSFSRQSMVFSGYRIYQEKLVVLDTTQGEIVIRMRPDHAPNSVWNFMHLVDGGFYTDILFHRILGPGTGDTGFVVQVGDPTAIGAGGPGYMIDLEDSKLPHDRGVLSMARAADPNSNGSQVFICLSRMRTQGLDGSYTAFGETIEGDDAIASIGDAGTVPPAGRPENEDAYRLISARLIDAESMRSVRAPISVPSAPAGR